jgi:tRNA pseudouridine65 synthase
LPGKRNRWRNSGGTTQAALTHYLRLARVELPFAVDRYSSRRYSLVRIVPETGRRQQIRKHFKHISHHLIGDTAHGNGRHNDFFRQHFGVHRLLLMSQRLGFLHPYERTQITISAQPDRDWCKMGMLFAFSFPGVGTKSRQ